MVLLVVPGGGGAQGRGSEVVQESPGAGGHVRQEWHGSHQPLGLRRVDVHVVRVGQVISVGVRVVGPATIGGVPAESVQKSRHSAHDQLARPRRIQTAGKKTRHQWVFLMVLRMRFVL